MNIKIVRFQPPSLRNQRSIPRNSLAVKYNYVVNHKTFISLKRLKSRKLGKIFRK